MECSGSNLVIEDQNVMYLNNDDVKESEAVSDEPDCLINYQQLCIQSVSSMFLLLETKHFLPDKTLQAVLEGIFNKLKSVLKKSCFLDLLLLLFVAGTNPEEMYVFLEKKPVIKVETFGEGLQIMFGLYFVFNLEYPKQASCVLELLQRYILKIHPDVGTKSKTLNTSKRKVISFLNKINLA